MRQNISNPHSLIVLILLLIAVFVAGCGGGESATATATPRSAGDLPATTPRSTQPPEEPSPTPTSDSRATEQRTPTAGPDATTGSGLSADVQRYIDITCIFAEEDEAETWGEASEQLQEQLERLRRNSPPEELREYFEARRGWWEPALEFMNSKDSNERADPEAASEFFDSTEMQPAFAAMREAIVKMDPDLVIALNDAGC